MTRNAQLNVTAYDSVTLATVGNLSINLTDLNASFGEKRNTTGTVLTFDIIKGNFYSLLFDVPGYAYETRNFTASTANDQAINQSLYKTNSISIRIYDEANLDLLTNLTTGGETNVTFISMATSMTYNTTTGTLFVSNITEGFYEVKFNAPLYNQRSYYVTVTNRSTQTLNAYLSQSSITLLLTYVDRETGELLEDCGIVIARVINGSWSTVASGFTDITGRYQSSVSPNTNYRFSSTCDGYEDKTFNLNPVIFTSYTIQLTKVQNTGVKLDFTNINVYVTNTTFRNNGTNTFAWQISSPAGELESFNMRLFTQCKNITSYSGVNAYGGTTSSTFNLTCAQLTDYVTLSYAYTLSNGTERSFTYTYSILGNTSQSSFTKNIDEHYGMGLFERSLIVVIIVVIIAGIVTKFSNIVAGLGAGLIVQSYLSYIGFIEWWLIAPTLLVGFFLITSWSQSR